MKVTALMTIACAVLAPGLVSAQSYPSNLDLVRAANIKAEQ